LKYWYDTEFIEDGKTVDLISIGIVAEDGRELYLQNRDAKFKNASDWVYRNVYPSLTHFHLAGQPDCQAAREPGDFLGNGQCHKPGCPWRCHSRLKDDLKAFCDPSKYGKPVLWGYYSAYDHVALCQIFGTMMELPDGWPMYTRDLKQYCDSLGNPELPKQGKGEHDALADARWNKLAYEFLVGHYQQQ
jgi:hypothetical protein